MQSSSQSRPGVCQIYTNSNCPQTDNGQGTADMELTADYWSWLLYEDWPETRFRLRPITRAGHRATLASSKTSTGRLLWAAVRCNYVVQLISTQREAAVVHVVGSREEKEDEERRGSPCAAFAYAPCAEAIYAIYCLRWHSMCQGKPSQAEPSQVGPPVVHWPFGRSLKLMQKLFDRFAIRRKNAKQTSGSDRQAVHQSSCQYANICIYSTCVCLCVCVWPVQGVCIIAVPKLEIYYNFHTSVTRCRRHSSIYTIYIYMCTSLLCGDHFWCKSVSLL